MTGLMGYLMRYHRRARRQLQERPASESLTGRQWSTDITDDDEAEL